MKKILSILILIILFLCTSVYGSEDPVSIELDRDTVPLHGTVNLDLTISGGNAEAPTLPPMSGLSVISSSVFNQTEIINFKVSKSLRYSFILRAEKEGQLTIPPITVLVDGSEYKTKPLELRVTHMESYAPPQRRPRLKIRSFFPFDDDEEEESKPPVSISAKLSKKELYLGEQLIAHVEVTKRYGGNIDSVLRSATNKNLLTEQLKPASIFQKFDSGMPESIERTTYLLYPLKEGELNVDGFILSYSSLGAIEELKTDQEQITVKPLPEVPDRYRSNFTKGVGKFQIHASCDATEVETGKPLLYKLEVTGHGNVSLVELKLPDFPNCRKFDTAEKSEKLIDGDGVVETKTFTTTLIPEKSGELTLPSTKFAFFNPNTGEYYETGSEPISIKVTGKDIKTTPTKSEQVQLGNKKYVGIRNSMHYRSYKIVDWKVALIAILPAIIFLFIKFTGKIKFNTKREKTPLKEFKAAIKSTADPYAAIQTALSEFLKRKLGISENRTTRDLLKMVEEQNVEKSLIDSFMELFDRCDEVRFMGGTSDADPKALLKQAVTVATQADKKIKKVSS